MSDAGKVIICFHCLARAVVTPEVLAKGWTVVVVDGEVRRAACPAHRDQAKDIGKRFFQACRASIVSVRPATEYVTA